MASIRTNSAVRGISGKSGDTHYAETPLGTQWKNNPINTAPPTPAQLQSRARLRKVGAAFRALTPAQHLAWSTYALTVTTHTKGGKAVSPSTYNAFVAVSSKFSQVNPTLPLPTLPPPAAFEGDTLIVYSRAEETDIFLVSTSGNTPNVITELMLQPLANEFRKPQKRDYVSRAFGAFQAGGSEIGVTVVPGAYAVAYRFVNNATGQEAEIVPVGTVVIV